MNANDLAKAAAEFAEAEAAAGAVPDTGTPASTEPIGDKAAEVATDADTPEVESAGQPAKEPDPWDSIKAKFNPSQIEKILEDAENTRAMQRAAHQRNEAAARERSMAEDAARKADAALARIQAIADAAGAIAAQGNHELAGQMLAAFSRSGEAAPNLPGTAPTAAGNPEVEQLKAKLAEIENRQNQIAFGGNHREVTRRAIELARANPVLNQPWAKELGVAEKVVQEAVASLYEQDKAEPGSVDPWNPRTLDPQVEKAIAAAAKAWEKTHDSIVKNYRAERKAKNAAVPPSNKGASAGVRAVPNPNQAPPPNLTRRQREDWLVNQFVAATPKRLANDI